jgi:hypothetical protein
MLATCARHWRMLTLSRSTPTDVAFGSIPCAGMRLSSPSQNFKGNFDRSDESIVNERKAKTGRTTMGIAVLNFFDIPNHS